MYSSNEALVLQAMDRSPFDALTLPQLREVTGMATLALVHTMEGLERRNKVSCVHAPEALYSLVEPLTDHDRQRVIA